MSEHWNTLPGKPPGDQLPAPEQSRGARIFGTPQPQSGPERPKSDRKQAIPPPIDITFNYKQQPPYVTTHLMSIYAQAVFLSAQ